MGTLFTTWVWTAAAFVVVAAMLLLYVLVVLLKDDHKKGKNNNNNSNKRKRLVMPPGPRGLPIIGHLHLLGKNPHQDLQRLSRTHGPIMHLRFGTVDTVVASSPQAAELFLKTHDLNFATRPPMKVADYLMYGKKDVVFGRYGPLWREMRKLFVVGLLGSQKVSSFEPVRREEACLLVESLKETPPEVVVDLGARVASTIGNMTCRMLFGRNNKYQGWGDGGGGGTEEKGGRGFKALIDEGGHLASLPNLGDYFPVLAKLDVQGLDRKAKEVRKHFDQFFERILGEHEDKRSSPMKDEDEDEEEDFVDIILAILTNKETPFEFTREHVKSLILDLVVASVDTSTTVILWTMSELIRNPAIMKKVKEEVGRQVGFGRVEEKDLEHLKYMEMVIKESLRMHPVVPLLLPHAAMQGCTVGGFHVPESATVVINVWAIGRDPSVWADPHRFFPERFEGISGGGGVDYRGRHFELIPFGSGRRSCPGMQLGLTMVRLVVAQLAHSFAWDLPNGDQDLDMTEEYGLTLNRAHPLMVIPTYTL